MTEWEPATEAEAAMRDALRMSDQELYFRILSRSELLLPVSADALAGRTAMGWGTWNSGGRTHVLSFTSSDAMRVCLAENAGSARKIAFHELADTWPNHEWWLAVNPGLPIEGYLPPWFVGQIARGDVRVPGRASSTRRDASAPRRSPQPPPAGHSDPLEPDDVLEADVLEADETQVVNDGAGERAAASARRAGFANRPAGRDPVRRLRRYEASIIDATVIDAEIISSTILGAGAMEAMVVDATVMDSRAANGGPDGAVIDVDVIDATVIDVDERTQVVNRGARPTGPGSAGPGSAGHGSAGHGSGGGSGPTAPMAAAATGARRRAAAAKGAGTAGISAGPSFTPANEVETNLLAAASSAKTDNFLSTLLLAKVLVPIPTGESPAVRPDDPAFPWRREVVDGQAYLVVFTSPERMTEFMGDGVVAVTAKFVQLIRVWPDVNWAFAVNPGTPVGATLPGAQIKALAVWAADVGLTADDPTVDLEEPPPPVVPPNTSTIIMQKPIAPSQVDYYLDRGYDRASGFVHRATEVAHLHTPEQIYSTLGLSYTGSPFQRDATDVYVLRWAAHRGDLYRIPYGGQHEAAMRAMQGWMIERAPFRGNGFAPAERGEVIAEFKVDSIRLPHGAQMWRLTSTGDRMLVAILDSDEGAWRAAIDAGVSAEWDPTVPLATKAPTMDEPTTVVPPPVPGSRAARMAPAVDPVDDPLDPRWQGRSNGRAQASWTASRVGER